MRIGLVGHLTSELGPQTGSMCNETCALATTSHGLQVTSMAVLVFFVTGNHGPFGVLQHLLSAEAQTLPQHELSLAQGKPLFWSLKQQTPSFATQAPPQH
jgi:type III secretory pathway component EscT